MAQHEHYERFDAAHDFGGGGPFPSGALPAPTIRVHILFIVDGKRVVLDAF